MQASLYLRLFFVRLPVLDNQIGNSVNCKFDAHKNVTKIIGWRKIKEDSELALQQAVALHGPVAVAIDTTTKDFDVRLFKCLTIDLGTIEDMDDISY